MTFAVAAAPAPRAVGWAGTVLFAVHFVLDTGAVGGGGTGAVVEAGEEAGHLSVVSDDVVFLRFVTDLGGSSGSWWRGKWGW